MIDMAFTYNACRCCKSDASLQKCRFPVSKAPVVTCPDLARHLLDREAYGWSLDKVVAFRKARRENENSSYAPC